MSRVPRAAAGLAVVYLLTLASTDPVDVVFGLAAGGLLAGLLGDRLRLGPGGAVPSLLERVVWFPAFAAAVGVDVLAGTWDVALRVLHLRSSDEAGVIRVPIGERSERGVAVTGLTATLSPGAVLLDVDWDRGDLLLHVFDAGDADAVRARMDRQYRRYQRRVFP